MDNKAGKNKDQLNNLNEVETVQIATANKDIGTTEQYGKFKDVKSLLDAYNSLQSEFTRRCQRVKELERENGVLQAENVKMTSDAARFGENENGINAEFDIKPRTISADCSGKSKQRSEEFKIGGNDNSRYVNDYENIDELYKTVQCNEEVKNKIIREYLDKVKNSAPNVTLMTGNGNAIVVPPLKPKNIVEAGELARRILNKGKIVSDG